MPRIFDNIDQHLLPALTKSLETAKCADFCVGYFNLRGWRELQDCIDAFPGGPGTQCRLLVGMQGKPDELLRQRYTLLHNDAYTMDATKMLVLEQQAAEEFRRQLMMGLPTNADEQGLRNLVRQLRDKKLVVKLFLRHQLHAKLYLLYRDDYNNPVVGFLGSSNLTLSGLSYQGELNVDVLDHDACQKLTHWFEDRWQDKWCVDISDALIQIIEDSWAREAALSPYEVYLKMAYHLAQEARAGITEFGLPKQLESYMFDYQSAAVRIAAHHLNKRGGVLLGDVVGLGKTLMATAIARIFQEDQALETLIICPKNLMAMWRQYIYDYRLFAEVVSLTEVTQTLPTLRRFRLVLIDESHNLRNPQGKRYKAIQDYIARNDSKCILLSATPYNKSFADLAAQLALFIPETRDLGIRPEHLLREMGGEAYFLSKHQAPVRSLTAFTHSEHPDDWRELMRLYMVRRTRSFIMQNYTETDPSTGQRFLRMRDGQLSYFPERVPRTVKFSIREDDPYSKLYSDEVVQLIDGLSLPRYGLGQYENKDASKEATATEKELLKNLSRAGKRLMGFSRTNMFKRLESSGASFLQTLDRHILRNCIFLYAIDHDLPLPIGTLEAFSLDPDAEDRDEETIQMALRTEDGDDVNDDIDIVIDARGSYTQRAEAAYGLFKTKYERRFKWLRPALLNASLRSELEADADSLFQILELTGQWDSARDSKLLALLDLLQQHDGQKILLFSQFADTVSYLYHELKARGAARLAMATGQSADPTALARRFSPTSNRADIKRDEEIDILLSTDVLSEGQNLQDSAIVINYDLPWAIIRLAQRAGRVDRIGQQAQQIYCYSFIPADGIEQIIRLRTRVRERLRQNGEVVGSDERFFEDDDLAQQLRDLYTEKSGILDGEADTEVDLASYAYQIWLNATKDNPNLAKKIEALPDVVYSTRQYEASAEYPDGVVTYMKTVDGTDALAWVNVNGESVTQSPLTILKRAKCDPGTQPIPRHRDHHELVNKAVDLMIQETAASGGQLGKPTSARFRTYERLKQHYDHIQRTAPLFVPVELANVIQDVHDYPLMQTATDTLNRQLRAGISDDDLAKLTIWMRSEGRLSLIQPGNDNQQEPRILCSLGLFSATEE